MRAVIFNPYGIGDVLFSLPVVSALKTELGSEHITFICNRRSAQVIENHPHIDKVIIYEKSEIEKKPLKGLFEYYNLIKEIKSSKADIAIDASLNRKLSFLLFLAGIPKRIGFNYKNRGTFLNKKVPLKEFEKNIALEYFRLIDAEFPNHNINPANLRPRIYLTDKEKAFAQNLLYNLGIETKKIISVFPGGGASWGKYKGKRLWPREKFIELIDRIIKAFPSCAVLIIGDKSDGQYLSINKLFSKYGNRVVNLCGKLSLRESLSLVACSSLAVSNDGGPAHMSAALGVSLISMMGPVPEDIYAPFCEPHKIKIITNDIECRPCYRAFSMPQCQLNYACIKEIPVDLVFNAVKDKINAPDSVPNT